MVFSAGTSLFDPNFAAKAKADVDAASSKDYRALKRASIKDHRRFYRRASLALPEGKDARKPTLERLIANDRGAEDPSLAALYFNFGRYLLISARYLFSSSIS